jgi:hypothetical protein
MLRRPAGVAGDYRTNAAQFIEDRFRAPKTAAAKHGGLTFIAHSTPDSRSISRCKKILRILPIAQGARGPTICVSSPATCSCRDIGAAVAEVQARV